MAKNKIAEVPAETTFNLTLGDKIYTLRFGTKTFMRIHEENPTLSTAFHAADELPPLEAIPKIIHAAIKPEDRQWESFDEFLDIYDNSFDPSISKVLTGYASAIRDVSKKLTPAMEALVKMQEK